MSGLLAARGLAHVVLVFTDQAGVMRARSAVISREGQDRMLSQLDSEEAGTGE